MPEGPTLADLSGDVQFECRVARIEAAKGVDAENTLDWVFSTTPPDVQGDISVAIPVGHLLVINDGSMGQVVVLGQVAVKASTLTADQTANDYVPGFVEEIWDVGRRALNMLTALMDADPLGLPVHSPSTPIEIMTAVAEDEEPPVGASVTSQKDDA